MKLSVLRARSLRSVLLFAFVALLAAVSVAGSIALAAVPALAADSASSGSDAGFPRTVVDGLGREIHLEAPPQRIFSVALAMDNILLSLVEPHRVAGVSTFANQPEWGSYVADLLEDHMVQVEALTPELVLAAQPDIVLVASWNDPDSVEQLRQLGVTIYTFTEFGPLTDALDNIVRMGEITGEDAKAAALVDEFYRRYDDIAARIEGREQPRVLYWDDWGTTYGPGISYHDLIVMSGGINVAEELGVTNWGSIDAEVVLRTNPDIIVVESSPDFVEQVLNDPVLQTVSAVQNGRVYSIDHMGALNEKYILAIEQMAQAFHPEAFDE